MRRRGGAFPGIAQGCCLRATVLDALAWFDFAEGIPVFVALRREGVLRLFSTQSESMIRHEAWAGADFTSTH